MQCKQNVTGNWMHSTPAGQGVHPTPSAPFRRLSRGLSRETSPRPCVPSRPPRPRRTHSAGGRCKNSQHRCPLSSVFTGDKASGREEGERPRRSPSGSAGTQKGVAPRGHIRINSIAPRSLAPAGSTRLGRGGGRGCARLKTVGKDSQRWEKWR